MEINFTQILFQAANFGLLLFILGKFLYRPVLKYLNDREKKVQAGIKAAETNLLEKNRLSELKTKALIKAEQEATGILETARKKAEAVGRNIVAEAKTSAQAEVKKEYALLEEKIQTERQQLQADIGKLVIDTTRKLLADTLTPNHQQAIISRQIRELKQLKSTK